MAISNATLMDKYQILQLASIASRYTMKPIKAIQPLPFIYFVMTTLVALNTWLNVSKLFISATSWYILAAQLVLLFFITRGVKAAYKADIPDDVCN